MNPQAAAYVAEESFERDTDYISDRITRDERDGGQPSGRSSRAAIA